MTVVFTNLNVGQTAAMENVMDEDLKKNLGAIFLNKTRKIFKNRRRKPIPWEERQARMADRNRDYASFADLPIVFRRKPTAHEQYCFKCRKPLNRDDKIVVINSGLWRGKPKSFKSVHIGSKKTRLGTLGTDEFLVNRKLYLHETCFGCLMNMMMKEANATISVDTGCEECVERFNCFTGNITIEKNSVPYIPSRSLTALCPACQSYRTKDLGNKKLECVCCGHIWKEE